MSEKKYLGTSANLGRVYMPTQNPLTMAELRPLGVIPSIADVLKTILSRKIVHEGYEIRAELLNGQKLSSRKSSYSLVLYFTNIDEPTQAFRLKREVRDDRTLDIVIERGLKDIALLPKQTGVFTFEALGALKEVGINEILRRVEGGYIDYDREYFARVNRVRTQPANFPDTVNINLRVFNSNDSNLHRDKELAVSNLDDLEIAVDCLRDWLYMVALRPGDL